MGSKRPVSGRTPLSPLRGLRTGARRASLVLPLAVLAFSCTPGERDSPAGDVIVDETYPAPAPEPAAAPDTIGAVPIEALSTRPRLINAAELSQAQRRLYPPRLLEAGIGGSSLVRVVIDRRTAPRHPRKAGPGSKASGSALRPRVPARAIPSEGARRSGGRRDSSRRVAHRRT